MNKAGEMSEPVKSNTVKPVRLKMATREMVDRLLVEANNKTKGRRVYPDDIILLALNLVTPEHISELKNASLRGSDIKEILFARYQEEIPGASWDEFERFQMTLEWPKFLKRHSKEFQAVA
ncbi:MAG: hypothetical protein CL678_06675 [Bdellovibrionaceae bacterium]|nr:hypothetical protein [Pseudobdellovibrionaceae bacterium]|tara:strand:+ start:1259 stop:1621 length:363 start_codon:yes stop_codon:yes gene_type:complete